MISDSNLINRRDKSPKNQLNVDLAMDKKIINNTRGIIHYIKNYTLSSHKNTGCINYFYSEYYVFCERKMTELQFLAYLITPRK